MPTIEQIRLVSEVAMRILLELAVFIFAVLILIKWLRSTWQWTFKREENEIEVKVERK